MLWQDLKDFIINKNKFMWKKGTKHTKQALQKIRLARAKQISPTLGKKWSLSEKIKQKLRESHKGKYIGSKNNNWKGGISIRKPTRPKPEQCEICGAFGNDFKKGLHFDHNHQTGEFRGWICLRCNFALGMVKDSKDLLNMLINYLNKNNI